MIIIILNNCEIHFLNEIKCVKELIHFNAQNKYVIISYQLLTSAEKRFYVQKLVSGTNFVVFRGNNFEPF